MHAQAHPVEGCLVIKIYTFARAQHTYGSGNDCTWSSDLEIWSVDQFVSGFHWDLGWVPVLISLSVTFLVASESWWDLWKRSALSMACVCSLAVLHVTSIEHIVVEFEMRVLSLSVEPGLLFSLDLLLSHLGWIMGSWQVLNVWRVELVMGISLLSLDMVFVLLFLLVLLTESHAA